MTKKEELLIKSCGRLISLTLLKKQGIVEQVRVNMGNPVFTREILVEARGKQYALTCVSMGNPHAVVLVEDALSFPVETVGPQIEHHPSFPNRTNAEFVQVLAKNHICMRVWERGTGETYACGTGACAAVAACVLKGLTDTQVTVKLLGGELLIEWNRRENLIYMQGPTVTIFEGEL